MKKKGKNIIHGCVMFKPMINRRVAGLSLAFLVLSVVAYPYVLSFLTSEYPSLGPGYGKQLSFTFDSTVTLNTVEPTRFVAGPLALIPQLGVYWWTLTGQGWQEPDGSYSLFLSRHAGVLTTDGQDWIEDQISDSPGTTPATCIATSMSPDAPLTSWNIITGEIDTGGGLDRVGGTYTSTGVGTWTVSKQFTADTTYNNVQLMGLHWSDTDSSTDNLLFADTFTPVSLIASDKITITATCSVS